MSRLGLCPACPGADRMGPDGSRSGQKCKAVWPQGLCRQVSGSLVPSLHSFSPPSFAPFIVLVCPEGCRRFSFLLPFLTFISCLFIFMFISCSSLSFLPLVFIFSGLSDDPAWEAHSQGPSILRGWSNSLWLLQPQWVSRWVGWNESIDRWAEKGLRALTG